METTIVIFRRETRASIFALCWNCPPTIRHWYCTCYQHIGQHCSADYHGCIVHSRSAKPDEYADLLIELERRGYHVEVRQRATPVMHERRRRFARV